MKTLISALGVATVAFAAFPAEARSSREYFVAHAVGHAAPRQLSQADHAYYTEVFDQIDRQNWDRVKELLAQRDDGLLQRVAEAEFYLAGNSPRVELPQILDWLQRGRNLPQAAQMGRLGLARGAAELPRLPAENALYSRNGSPKRVKPRSVDDGTMPDNVRSQILDRIVNDDPDGARQLLDGIDGALSGEARAEWRQRVAWSYYIENRDEAALAMASAVSAGKGAWVAEGDWVAGLAAWRLGDCGIASDAFQRAAYGAVNPELRAASYYWAARSALRCREPDKSADFLRHAAQADETLYGMLAAEQLGMELPARLAHSDFSDADWRRIGGIENVRIAIALSEIGRDRLSSEVLLHQARLGDPADYGPLSRLARDLGMPSTQLYMAYNAPNGGEPDPSSYYPTPKWEPVTGWRVDPALAYAHTLQESNFRANAISPANAQGLMQITPITVREHAGRLGLSASQVDILDPGYNLAFGQQNLEMLRDQSATRGALPKIMAAYNAGLSPVTRWNSEINDQNDPLLYMESIPYWETRGYVAIVMRNYWMYQRQAHAPSDSRVALAQNDWPKFPDADGDNRNGGRVYLSAGAQ
ncbi:soluble lytic murein transglycosylase-like protein [Altererythrobacter atlanticus]|uniref:Soluble lytic murein transglycosylase n=1 Tax=Croceibacterium atlanticum TaxID=1267766 RepID=A0A0F7KME0_9SPHN|nr:lytic transglycosylase domain-containing protein [Croceibacterium atlanticum]AKH41733.1 Soluble lytic murein transglycosylase precursor [Croceibacterium atlanticum]MBB5733197.1 soluble lytic murein transglycosylase-like protein [Croceibacterium atlanticum]